MQIAKAYGASEIIAVDVDDEKLQKAKTLGATLTVNAIKEDAVEKIRVCMIFLYEMHIGHFHQSFDPILKLKSTSDSHPKSVTECGRPYCCTYFCHIVGLLEVLVFLT